MLRIWTGLNGTRLGALWEDQEAVFTLTAVGDVGDFARTATDDGEEEQLEQPLRLTHTTHSRRGDCLELNLQRIVSTPEPGEVCTICAIEEGEEPWPENTCVRMPCNHVFHIHCITPWARDAWGDCPNCKYIFYADECGYEAAVEKALEHEEKPPAVFLPASEIIDQTFHSTEVVIELHHGSVDAAIAVSLVRHVTAMFQAALPRAIIRTSSENKEVAESIRGVWQGVAVVEELPSWPPAPQF